MNIHDTGIIKSGRTTRLVDQAVQEFFTTGKATLVDHFDGVVANERLRKIFLHRMYVEHSMLIRRDLTESYIEINRKQVLVITSSK